MEKPGVWSLRRQLLLSSSLSFLVLGGLLVMLFSQLVTTYTEKSNRYIESVLDQYAQSINDRFESLHTYLLLTTNDPTLQKFLGATTPWERFEGYRAFSNNTRTYLSLAPGIEDYIVLVPDGDSFDLPLEPAYRKLVLDFAATNRDGLLVSRVQKMTVGALTSQSFFLGVNGQSTYAGLQTGMTAIIRVNIRSFLPDASAQPFADQWRYFVLDSEGQVISANNPALLFQPKTPVSPPWLSYSRPLPGLQGSVVVDVPGDFLTQDMVRTLVGTLILFAVIFACLLAINLVIIQKTNRTNQTLIRSIREIRERGEGSPDLQIDRQSYREAQDLFHEFQKMNEALIDMGRELVEKQTNLYRLELKAQAAENEYLLTQINPHFLYNSFETIKGMAAMAQQPGIVNITSALARIFRYSLKADAEVPLADELSIARAYLDIQSLRFAGRFTVSYDIDEETLSCLIPKMILQPLVENAVVHGLEALAHGGLLWVSAARADDRTVEITVGDNGGGIEAVHLKRIREELEQEAVLTPDRKAHIGLKNVHDRVRLAYGAPYGLTLESPATPSGTRARLKIPCGRNPSCSAS